jgi:NADPH2:quinone reductase
MKAVRVHEYGEPEVMRLEETPDPAPGPGQVVVRLHAAGVNPVDSYIRAGQYGSGPLPYTPGTDGAGVVEAIGEGVDGIREGERVYIAGSVSGAYAEKALCEAAQVHLLPSHVTFAQGAALGVPYGTAYRALFQRARALPGEVVLVDGASGGVGTATVQFARAAGMTVIGTAGSDEGRRHVLDQGAHHVLDHHADDYLKQVPSITGGRGVDVVVEFMANANLGHVLGVLAPKGRVAVVGSRGPVEIDPRETMGRESDIRGVTLMAATDQERASIHAAIGAGLVNGTLRPVVGVELPLGEAARAHRMIFEQHARGKVVLIP